MRRFALFALALSSSGCFATYAPPVRVNHTGAPMPIRSGSGEIAGGSGQAAFGQMGFAPVDDVRIEVGLENQSGIGGYLGGRWSFFDRDYGRTELTMDAELGLGIGQGAERCSSGTNCRGPSLQEIDVEEGDLGRGGAYLGYGLAGRWRWFSLYARTRLQLAGAQAVPATFWYSAHAGMQFSIRDTLHLFLGHAGGGFTNRIDSVGWHIVLFEAGAVLRFGP